MDEYDITNREKLVDMGCEDSIVFENPDYDDAIVGVDQEGRVIYDYDKMVASLMKQDNLTAEEAIEFIDFNTVRALPYAGAMAPIIMYGIE